MSHALQCSRPCTVIRVGHKQREREVRALVSGVELQISRCFTRCPWLLNHLDNVVRRVVTGNWVWEELSQAGVQSAMVTGSEI